MRIFIKRERGYKGHFEVQGHSSDMRSKLVYS